MLKDKKLPTLADKHAAQHLGVATTATKTERKVKVEKQKKHK